MVREFKLPDVGEGVAEGELVQWLVEPGDSVSEDQPVAEVETDKAMVEVPSPVNGTVRELLAEEGEMVPVGNVIITFDVEGEPVEEGKSEAEAAAAGESTEAEPAEADQAEAEPAEAEESAGGTAEPAESGSADTGAEEVSTPSGHVFAPPSARRLARELGVDIESVQGSGPSGRVTEDDVRTAAESGEPEGPSEAATEAAGEEATTAEAGGDAAETSAGEEAAEGAAATPTQTAVESADRDRTLAAPATRKLAAEEGVDLDAVPATEERDGEAFVTPEAVMEYAEAQRAAQEADAEALAAGETRTEGETREPYRGVRRTIGEAMERSKYTAPHVTHHDEVDVTRLVEVREELKPIAEERGFRLTYLPFVMKALVPALREFPIVNSSLDEEADEIVKKHYVNIGVATATDVGLMVPVVKDVPSKGLLELSSEMNELVSKARERTIAVDEMQGGTFTVTNIGGIGGEYATPIVNYPEAAILAIGEIKKKPRVVEVAGDGEDDVEERIEPRHVMTLSLSFDHRLIDGAVGAQFTNAVTSSLEHPERLLLE